MNRLTNILFLAFALHVLLSFIFIFSPSFLKGKRFSKIYKTHLLPGPFFSEDRIVDSYMLSVTWKVNGQWSQPVNPAKENFAKYQKSFKPTDLYRSRFERSLYQQLLVDSLSIAEISNKRKFQELKKYLIEHYVPAEADSLRVLITRKQAKGLKVNMDTLHVFVIQ